MTGGYFFVDMNSFFASVEQQERKELRGRPIIVAPLLADSTCAIAASSEAKALGIGTGTPVRKAKLICPEIRVIEARPRVYLDYHAAILEELNGIFTSVKALSVDEMACGVGRNYRGRERELCLLVKARFRSRLGEMMRCSTGVAPNVFLAKVAAETQKPDGLTIFEEADLPGKLFDLHLLDLPGIGPRMAARLERSGIRTVEQLYAASAAELRMAWGSVVGARWWYMLRGSLEADYGAYLPEVRKSVGHSHVLPPEFRTTEGAKAILMRLFSKALERLRKYGQLAGSVQVQALYRGDRSGDTYSWRAARRKCVPANDGVTWLKSVRPLVDGLPAPRLGFHLKWVGITFTDLLLKQDLNLSLFTEDEAKVNLGATLDAINAKCAGKVGMGDGYLLREEAPVRIAFGQVC